MRKALCLIFSLALLMPASALAQGSAPVQVSPQGGSAQGSTPQVQPATPPGQIPIPQSTDPAPEDKKAKQAEKDQQYAMLVILCALLPIAAFGFWRLWTSSSQSKGRYQPHRYSTGPADKRRVKRRNKR